VNLPSTDATAFSCAALSLVPYVMSAGFGQVMTGMALATVSETVAWDVAYFVPSVGVKVAVSVWLPAVSTSPAAGV